MKKARKAVPKIRVTADPRTKKPDPKDLPEFEYRCSNGHDLAGDKPVTVCPAVVRGEPCKGTLVRVGKGAGRGSHKKAATR